MATQLHVLRGGVAVETFRLTPGLHVLGSGTGADLVLPEASPAVVCRVELTEDGEVFLRALDDEPLLMPSGEGRLAASLANGTFADVKGLRVLRLDPSAPPKVTYHLPLSDVPTAPSPQVRPPLRELLALKVTVAGDTQVGELQADQVTLGRGPGNTVSFAHPEVSRRHARLFRKPDGPWVEDLDSAHGTYLNGTQITSAQLRPGARLTLSGAADAPVLELGDLSDALSERGVDETLQPIRGNGEAMRQLRSQILRAGKQPGLLLLLGENGTGKEVAARCAASVRGGPFVAVNCGAIPDTLIESELFGTTRGAYTGAVERPGKFEQAKDGTLLLDEIGELSMPAQASLLRVLQSLELTRVGGTATVPVRCRVIAATNRDLKAMKNAGTFREDLYHRLMVLVIQLPPLRAHMDDLPLLARQHLRDSAGRASAKTLSPEALTKLMGHRWPGNVRELVNTLERAAVKPQSDGGEIPASAIVFAHELDLPSAEVQAASTKGIGNLPEQMNALERDMCERALADAGDALSAAALVGLTESSFRRCMKRHGLTVPKKEAAL